MHVGDGLFLIVERGPAESPAKGALLLGEPHTTGARGRNEPCCSTAKEARRPVTAKGKAKLARVVAIQQSALKLIGRNGHWDRLNNGPEVMKYEDAAFLIIFYVRDPVPVELRTQFNLGPLSHGLYSLELWAKGVGKVLNLSRSAQRPASSLFAPASGKKSSCRPFPQVSATRTGPGSSSSPTSDHTTRGDR